MNRSMKYLLMSVAMNALIAGSGAPPGVDPVYVDTGPGGNALHGNPNLVNTPQLELSFFIVDKGKSGKQKILGLEGSAGLYEAYVQDGTLYVNVKDTGGVFVAQYSVSGYTFGTPVHVFVSIDLTVPEAIFAIDGVTQSTAVIAGTGQLDHSGTLIVGAADTGGTTEVLDAELAEVWVATATDKSVTKFRTAGGKAVLQTPDANTVLYLGGDGFTATDWNAGTNAAAPTLTAVGSFDPGTGSGTYPVITGVPTISGTAAVGETLTASPASVTGDPVPTRTWQWYRGAVPISGATAITYLVQEADRGNTISVIQSENNTEGGASALSSPTSSVPVIPGTETVKLYSLNRAAVLTVPDGTTKLYSLNRAAVLTVPDGTTKLYSLNRAVVVREPTAAPAGAVHHYDFSDPANYTYSAPDITAATDIGTNGAATLTSDAGKYPSLTTINGRDAANFDGTDDILQSTTGLDDHFDVDGRAYTFAVAFQMKVTGNTSALMGISKYGATQPTLYLGTRGGLWSMRVRNSSIVFAEGGTEDTSPHVLIMVMRADDTVDIYLDGTKIVDNFDTSESGQRAMDRNISIGAMKSFVTVESTWANAKIGEAMWYPSALSASNVADLNTHLSDKWL